MEILMTMAPVINEGVPSLSFRLKDDEHIVSNEQMRELLDFQREAREQVNGNESVLEGFWSMISGEDNQQRSSIQNPIIWIFHSWMRKRIFGRMKESKVIDMEVNWLYLTLVARQAIDPSYIMINQWCCEPISGSGQIGSGCYLSMIAISVKSGITRNTKFILAENSL
jgi:hypothetical protein